MGGCTSVTGRLRIRALPQWISARSDFHCGKLSLSTRELFVNQTNRNRRSVADNRSPSGTCTCPAVIPAIYHPYDMAVHNPLLWLVSVLDKDLQESDDCKVGF